MRVRVDRRRRPGVARNRDERPAALTLPIGDPAAPLAVRERAIADGDQLADGGMQLRHHAPQEGVVQGPRSLHAIEQLPCLAQGKRSTALEPAREETLLDLRAVAPAIRGPPDGQRDAADE